MPRARAVPRGPGDVVSSDGADILVPFLERTTVRRRKSRRPSVEFGPSRGRQSNAAGIIDDATLPRRFPDAKVVWTHRDPKASLPSLGSMFRTFADMCESGPVDLAAIGREQLAFWSLAADRADATLAAKNAPPCAHVKHAAERRCRPFVLAIP